MELPSLGELVQRQECAVNSLPSPSGDSRSGHQFDETRLAQFRQPRLQHGRRGSSQAARNAREVSALSRSSQTIRRVQRRPSRSSSAMIGRPDVEPRTARFFMAEICFGINGSLAFRYR